MDLSLAMLAAGLAAGAGICGYLVVADEKRFLSQFSLYEWQGRRYQAMVSNFLEAIRQEGLKAPWPRRLNGLSAAVFGLRIRRVLKARPRLRRSGFLHSHLNLAALLRMVKPFIDDEILARQALVARGRIGDMGDTADRDRLEDFVERVDGIRAALRRRFTRVDVQIQAHLRSIQFMPKLGELHAIFQEHGYVLLRELDDLRAWESMEGSELAQRLPVLTAPKAVPMWSGLVTYAER